MKQVWGAPERNKEPILEVLRRVLPEGGTLLEIASGSGQHAAWFARAMQGWTFLPSDVDDENLASIAAHVDEAQLDNLRPPRWLDVQAGDWGVTGLDAIFCANMIHIAPEACTDALIAGAARALRAGGHLILYGPFRLHGAHTAESNVAFDESLKARDPRWGIRDAEHVIELARTAGLSFVERVEMPANNQTIVLERGLSARS